MTAPETPAAPSPLWLALRIIDEPVEVFRSLAEKRSILVPLLLIVVGVGIATALTPQSVFDREAEMQIQMIEDRAPDQLTEERRQEILDGAGSMQARIMRFVFGSVAIVLFWVLATAGVLLLIFNAYGSEPLTYKDQMAIAAHAYMPQVLGMFVMVLLIRFAGFEATGLTLGFLFDPEEQTFLNAIGTQFTLFGAWNMFLLALGSQILTKTKTLGGPLMIVASLWVLVNLALGALAGATGAVMG
jgi:hypothetical protein